MFLDLIILWSFSINFLYIIILNCSYALLLLLFFHHFPYQRVRTRIFDILQHHVFQDV